MIKYGLISQTDIITLQKTMDLILKEFNEVINTCEVGVYSGLTSNAICEYIHSKDRGVLHIGIDNLKDGEQIKSFPPKSYAKLIIGNSSEVYNQLEDNSQHLLFIDSCHCFAHVVSDFFCYADKVKVGGYFCFHDTGKHIKPFKDFQHGDKSNPDAYIYVRKALYKIGLFRHFEECKNGGLWMPQEKRGWELIFDEADINNPAGGVSVFKKLY